LMAFDAVDPNDPTQLLLRPMPHQQDGQLGNRLSAFFLALGVATVAGLPVNTTPFIDSGLHLNLKSPAIPAGTEFSRLPELLHYCSRCRLNLDWPHECPGFWTQALARQVLQRQLHHVKLHKRRPEIIIQFRCRTHTLASPVMGGLPLDYYLAALEGNVNSTSQIGILMDPGALESSCCSALATALEYALRRLYRCTVTLVHPSTVSQDFVTMMRAKVLVGSVSTFGLWAAMGTHGRAYLPVSHIFGNHTTLCFPGVHWVRGPINSQGCTVSFFDWFMKSNRFPQILPNITGEFEKMVNGRWFARPRRLPFGHLLL